MTESASPRRPRLPRGRSGLPARIAVPVAAGLVLAACGPSPVDMVEHPVTTTPSRMAGEELQRAAEPEDACAPEPAPAQFPGTGERRAASGGPDSDEVPVPRDPERILALGAAAVDVACALGLQDSVVGTSGLPPDAHVFLPDPLVELPEIPLTADTSTADVTDAARELDPDLIVVADRPEGEPDVSDVLEDVAPTVVYDPDVVRWADTTEQIADAYGRPDAGEDVLLDVMDRVRSTELATTPSDSRVSLLSVTGEGDPGVRIQAPDTLGSLMLEAVDANRPPTQRTLDGERIPPAPESPQVGDELDGDVIYAVVGGHPRAEERAREVFASDRWRELDAVGARRMFVVDRAIWEGAGPVAARAVLADIEESINGIAPEG